MSIASAVDVTAWWYTSGCWNLFLYPSSYVVLSEASFPSSIRQTDVERKMHIHPSSSSWLNEWRERVPSSCFQGQMKEKPTRTEKLIEWADRKWELRVVSLWELFQLEKEIKVREERERYLWIEKAKPTDPTTSPKRISFDVAVYWREQFIHSWTQNVIVLLRSSQFPTV